MFFPCVWRKAKPARKQALTADFNIRTREELAAASPAFPLTGIIDSYGFNPELEINLMQPRWLERINECYTEENLPLMKAYLLCRVAGSCISRVDEACYFYSAVAVFQV